MRPAAGSVRALQGSVLALRGLHAPCLAGSGSPGPAAVCGTKAVHGAVVAPCHVCELSADLAGPAGHRGLSLDLRASCNTASVFYWGCGVMGIAVVVTQGDGHKGTAMVKTAGWPW